MDAARFCEFCKNINFEALRSPLISDLPTLKEGHADRSRYPFKDKGDDTHKQTTLGSFGDIIRRSEACRLCQLIRDALSQQAARRPSDGDVCGAEVSFFGVYRDLHGGHYWIRRLSILVDAVSTGGPKRSLFFAFQACNVGAASVQVDEQFADPRPGVDMMVFGGRRRPLLLDLRWVQRWIDICKTDHGIACERPYMDPKQSLERIRFIDVERMCIITMENVRLSEHHYIALSYVWGGPQKLQLKTDNKEDLAKPGALTAGSLPRTIEDSILLVKSLGFRNLWIDALCIIQDDDADKAIQIAAMNEIYGSAFFTIMAASAPNVQGDLPGLRPGSRSRVQEELVVIPATKDSTSGDIDPGLSLMTALQPLANPNEHYLEHTPWNSRGWTMQERVLSHRVLVFMPEQVYWVCEDAIFCEESYFENSSVRFNRFHEHATEMTLRRSFRNFYEPDDEQLRFWKHYQSLVSSYTRRTFSYQGDVSDGFLAVTKGLSALSGHDFTWGLPRTHFEQGLLWTSFTGLQRRKEVSTLPMTSLLVNVHFPSWSWMGWIGEASICIGDERCDIDIGETPEILCFEHHHDPLRLERVRNRWASYDSADPRYFPSWKRNHNQPVTLEDLEAKYPTLVSARLSKIPETQLIFFWTSSAFFTLVPAGNNDGHSSAIADSSGLVVGFVGKIASGGSDYDDNDQGRQEFVVIGSRQNQFWHPMLLVLQIEWRDAIAYRVNYGEINAEAWEREIYAWKLICLK